MYEGDAMNLLRGKFCTLKNISFIKKLFLLSFLQLLMSIGGVFAVPRGAAAQPAVSSALQIVRGLYGDLTLEAGVADVTAILQKNVQNNQLYFPANQSKATWLGDAAPGRAKSLLIIFRIGNNLYLKLIADMATDTISPATAQNAMLLIGSPASAQAPVAVPAMPRTQQQAAVQPSRVQSQMLGGVAVTLAQPGTASPSSAPSQQEVQMRNVQQQRMQQFRGK